MKLRLLSVLLSLAPWLGCTATDVQAVLLDRTNESTLTVYTHDQRPKVLSLEIVISGWKVSCSKTRAIVWGQTTRELPLGEPPYAEVYVLDLHRGGILDSFTTNRGPFDIEFDSAGSYVIVDDFVIDAESGRIKFTEVPPSFKQQAETCPDFPGRVLR